IFHEGGQRRAGQPQAAGIAPVLQPCHDAEALRIALEMQEVAALPLAQAGDQRGAWAGAEEMLDGRLAEMAEGRIADVMPDAGRGDDMTELGRAQPRQIAAMPLHDRLAD